MQPRFGRRYCDCGELEGRGGKSSQRQITLFYGWFKRWFGFASCFWLFGMETVEETIFQTHSGHEATDGGSPVNLGDAKLVYAFSCIVLSLIILSPTLAMVIPSPSGERFSELWL